jgi:hypothetical protein
VQLRPFGCLSRSGYDFACIVAPVYDLSRIALARYPIINWTAGCFPAKNTGIPNRLIHCYLRLLSEQSCDLSCLQVYRAYKSKPQARNGSEITETAAMTRDDLYEPHDIESEFL